MIRILLVDDHALFRSGIGSVLNNVEDFEVVGEASDGEEAIRMNASLQPQVILMDVNMPGIGGVEATRRIMRHSQGVKVIAVTAVSEGPLPSHLLDAGAVGYISKGCPADELLQAIRATVRGENYLSQDVAQKIAIEQLTGRSVTNPLQKLSPRELQVMTMIVDGQGNQQISDALFLSPKTISTYRYRLYEKLGVANDVELTHYAIRHNVIGNKGSS